MPFLRLDETDFTSTLKASLDGYVSNRSSINSGRAYTPHSTKQAIKSLKGKSQCFDLIKRIGESSMLILEVKVTNDLLQFKSFSEIQHNINKELKKAGIPIEYCYNLKDDYGEQNDDEYTLKFSNTASPENVCNKQGQLIKKELHVPLKGLVDAMMEKSSQEDTDSEKNNEKPGKSDKDVDNSDDTPEASINVTEKPSNIGALFTKGFVERLQEINLKMLFFAYNADKQQTFILDHNDLLNVYAEFSKYVSEEISIDMRTATLEEIQVYFSQAQTRLRTILANYDKKLEHKRETDFSQKQFEGCRNLNKHQEVKKENKKLDSSSVKQNRSISRGMSLQMPLENYQRNLPPKSKSFSGKLSNANTIDSYAEYYKNRNDEELEPFPPDGDYFLQIKNLCYLIYDVPMTIYYRGRFWEISVNIRVMPITIFHIQYNYGNYRIVEWIILNEPIKNT